MAKSLSQRVYFGFVYSSGYYAHLEASNFANGDQVTITTGGFLRSDRDICVSFDYNMYDVSNLDMGSLAVQTEADSQSGFQDIEVISGKFTGRGGVYFL